MPADGGRPKTRKLGDYFDPKLCLTCLILLSFLSTLLASGVVRIRIVKIDQSLSTAPPSPQLDQQPQPPEGSPQDRQRDREENGGALLPRGAAPPTRGLEISQIASASSPIASSATEKRGNAAVSSKVRLQANPEQVERALFSAEPSPLFVHVPKTAGEAVKAAFNRLKVHVRSPVIPDAPCSWHTPPLVHERGGFTVVRPVLKRVVSEFCWVRQQDMYQVYKREYGVREVWPYTCEMFNDWLFAALTKAKKEPWYPDCHMVPQWCFASRVDFVVRHGKGMQKALRSVHPALSKLSLGQENYDKGGPCERFNISTHCVNSSNLQLLQEHFRDDFKYIDPMFEGGIDLRAPVGVPGDWVVEPAPEVDVQCSASDTKLLTPGTPSCDLQPQAPGPTSNQSASSQCVSSLLECARLALRDSACGAIINYFGTAKDGPAGKYPGRCHCVLRGHYCRTTHVKGGLVATLSKSGAVKMACPAQKGRLILPQ